MESLAKELWDDLAALEGPLGQTRFGSAEFVHGFWLTKETILNRDVASPLLESYLPEAQSSAFEIVKSLQNLIAEYTSAPMSPITTRVSVFVGKVALALATDSSFVERLVPNEDGRQSTRGRSFFPLS